MGIWTKGLHQIPVRSRVFVSYYHDQDQFWYDRFSALFGDAYEVVTDRSLERRIDSDDPEYVRRAIRERNITGTSMTVVLCGGETWKRRWVDWEIFMTLNKQHALLGVVLPNHIVFGESILVPDRLAANIRSGYAHWVHWTESPFELSQAISTARERAKQTRHIDNSLPQVKRSRP